MLTNFIRRILGAVNFPRYQVPLSAVEPQVYQPPVIREVPKPLPPFTPGADRGIP